MMGLALCIKQETEQDGGTEMKFRKTIAMLLAVSMIFTGNGFTALALEPDDHAVGSSQVQDSGFVSNEEMVNDDGIIKKFIISL